MSILLPAGGFKIRFPVTILKGDEQVNKWRFFCGDDPNDLGYIDMGTDAEGKRILKPPAGRRIDISAHTFKEALDQVRPEWMPIREVVEIY